ncbi:ABC transporter ATP-binding protein [Pirellula sp. SH-Sr6A]|uniref:ABC transporter ATP-binding protein n=1 Tax=Pirellula sp. SH-Sr6A TaxID=1632865 RepID=UPI0011BAAD5E|nr:ABC transporter ATP-binding protein [Pirellula sp. SH-Sr6A]
MGRPRFFFELSRAILALAFLIWAPSLTFALVLPNINVPGVNFAIIRQLVLVLAAMFCLTAVLGYLTSFLTGRRRHGRAYECTSWFFCVFGGIAMVTFGYIAIPDPPRGLLPAIPGVMTCCTGLALLSSGVLEEAMRAMRTEPSNATEPGLQGFAGSKSTFPER